MYIADKGVAEWEIHLKYSIHLVKSEKNTEPPADQNLDPLVVMSTAHFGQYLFHFLTVFVTFRTGFVFVRQNNG